MHKLDIMQKEDQGFVAYSRWGELCLTFTAYHEVHTILTFEMLQKHW